MDYCAFINPVSKFLCFARIRSDAQKNKGPAFYVRLTDGTYVGSLVRLTDIIIDQT